MHPAGPPPRAPGNRQPPQQGFPPGAGCTAWARSGGSGRRRGHSFAFAFAFAFFFAFSCVVSSHSCSHSQSRSYSQSPAFSDAPAPAAAPPPSHGGGAPRPRCSHAARGESRQVLGGATPATQVSHTSHKPPAPRARQPAAAPGGTLRCTLCGRARSGLAGGRTGRRTSPHPLAPPPSHGGGRLARMAATPHGENDTTTYTHQLRVDNCKGPCSWGVKPTAQRDNRSRDRIACGPIVPRGRVPSFGVHRRGRWRHFHAPLFVLYGESRMNRGA